MHPTPLPDQYSRPPQDERSGHGAIQLSFGGARHENGTCHHDVVLTAQFARAHFATHHHDRLGQPRPRVLDEHPCVSAPAAFPLLVFRPSCLKLLAVYLSLQAVPRVHLQLYRVVVGEMPLQ